MHDLDAAIGIRHFDMNVQSAERVTKTNSNRGKTYGG